MCTPRRGLKGDKKEAGIINAEGTKLLFVCVQSKFELRSKRVSSQSESALIKASLSADLTDTHCIPKLDKVILV